MANMTFEVPTEFKTEEKWLKYLPTRSFVLLVVGAAISFTAARIAKSWKVLIVGAIIVAIPILLNLIPYYSNKALSLKGVTLDVFFAKKFIHKTKRRIYIKNIKDFEYAKDLEEQYAKILEEKQKSERI